MKQVPLSRAILSKIRRTSLPTDFSIIEYTARISTSVSTFKKMFRMANFYRNNNDPNNLGRADSSVNASIAEKYFGQLRSQNNVLTVKVLKCYTVHFARKKNIIKFPHSINDTLLDEWDVVVCDPWITFISVGTLLYRTAYSQRIKNLATEVLDFKCTPIFKIQFAKQFPSWTINMVYRILFERFPRLDGLFFFLSIFIYPLRSIYSTIEIRPFIIQRVRNKTLFIFCTLLESFVRITISPILLQSVRHEFLIRVKQHETPVGYRLMVSLSVRVTDGSLLDALIYRRVSRVGHGKGNV